MPGNSSSRSLDKSVVLEADPEHFDAEHDYQDDANEFLYETDAATSETNQDLIPPTTINRKKKIKNRHVKAACMIAVIWTIMVAFIVAAMSVDWWSNIRRDQSDLCSLCGKGALSMEEVELTDWPTRSPSSKTNPSLFTMLESSMPLRPPPNNIHQVCAPSIYLDYGPTYSGPSVDDLVSLCANMCFPATCCLANDEEAKLGLIATLESQGLGAQAESYLKSIKNCYVGGNVATCKEYERWCSTLYRLDVVLEDVVSNEVNAPCTTIDISPRSFHSDRLRDECSDKCNPLLCCYEDVKNSTDAVIKRKRKRQHVPFDSGWQDEGKLRKLASNDICQSFTAPNGSLNAQICDAYAPSCKSQSSTHTTILIPSLTRPTSVSFTSANTSDMSESSTNYSQPMLLLNSNMSQAPSISPHATLSHVPSHSYRNESKIPTVITISQIPTNGTGLNVTILYAPSHQSGNESFLPSQQFPTAVTTLESPSQYESTEKLGNESMLLSQIPTMQFEIESIPPTVTSQVPTSGTGPNVTISYAPSHQSVNETSVPSQQFPTNITSSESPSSYEQTSQRGNASMVPT